MSGTPDRADQQLDSFVGRTDRVDPFPIIVGAARSGTTLLRAMLNGHPHVAIPPESYFLVGFAREVRSSRPFEPVDFVESVIAHRRFVLWDLDPELVVEAVRAANPSTMADGIRTLYGLYASVSGKTRFGDKTPWYVEHISEISRLLPESRFVHVVRDGHDVSLSAGKGEVVGAVTWRRAIRKARRAGLRLPGRYLEVRYEDLVTQPEASLRSVCDFVSVPFDGRMLEYWKVADEERERFFRPDSAAHRRLSEPPSLRRDDWTVRMDPYALRRFEVLAGNELQACDYPLGAEPGGFRDAATAHLLAGRIAASSLRKRIGKRLSSIVQIARLQTHRSKGE